MIGIRKMRASSELMVSFLTTGKHPGYEIVENGLPSDARIIGLSHDVFTGLIEVILASASWDGPMDCAAIPELPPVRAERAQ